MGNRPTDWHVLDLDEDPVPGDPDRVKQLARELHDFADDVADALRQIKGMAGEDALLRWAGRTAKAFQDEFEEVPKNLRKLQRSYDLAGDALAAYWPKLERAQSLADKALARGREARNELSSATGRLDSANSWVERATAKTKEYDDKEGKEKPDESEVRAATRNATDAKSAQTSAQTAVDNAEGGLVRHCGPTEYRATGGGERVWADGIDTNTGELLDTKFVEKPGRSPFIPDSPNIPDFIRTKIVDEIDDEFARYGAVINDPGNPLTGLRVITNHPDAVPFFQGKMQQHGIPGRVDLAP